MSKAVGVVLAQLSPRLRQTDENLETIRGIVAEHPHADLVVFPELFLSGYTVIDVDGVAIRADGPELKELADLAQSNSTALIVGVAGRSTGGGFANSAVCVDEYGEIAGIYQKAQLYGEGERGAFVAGEELRVVELCGLKVGIMICFDIEFPEIARVLARGGAELLVTISANMEPFGDDHAIFARARALENRLPHVYVNQVGPGEGGLVFTGESTMVTRDGVIVAQAGPSEETVLDRTLHLTPGRDERPDYLSELRLPTPQVRETGVRT